MVTFPTIRAGADGPYCTYRTATLIERTNLPDTLTIVGAKKALLPLCQPGMRGIFEWNGETLLTGPLTQFRGWSEVTDDGTYLEHRQCTFASDLIWLWDRIAYPDPTLSWASQDTDGDTRTGKAETIALAFATANAGAVAGDPDRATSLGLTFPASLGRGSTITKTAANDVLGRLIADILEGEGLRITAKDMTVAISTTADLSATARYGTADVITPGVITAYDFTVNRPSMTDARVNGGGDGVFTVNRSRNTAGADARTLWGARIEGLVSESGTTDTDELDKAGDDAVAAGASPVEISSVEVKDGPGQILGRDVPPGSTVGVDMGEMPIVDRLRTVATLWDTAGVHRTGTVGPEDAGLTRDQKTFLRLSKAIRKGQ